MGFGSIWPWLIVLVIVLLLFGRGKVSSLMGDVAQGMKSFRRGLSDDDETSEPRAIEQTSDQTVDTAEAGQKRNAG